MRVKNRKCIRRLSFKSLWASRKRNIIAICAIALTTLMFTSLFTIMLSVNSSYEIYNFRQAGGYSDGIFKDLSREQADKIAAHKGVKASGERIVCEQSVQPRAETYFKDIRQGSGGSKLHG